MSATFLWQFDHNFLEVLLKVTVLLRYHKAVIISSGVEDNGKFAIQKLRDNAKALKFKLPHVLGTYGRGSSAALTGNKTAVCVQKTSTATPRSLCWDTQNLLIKRRKGGASLVFSGMRRT